MGTAPRNPNRLTDLVPELWVLAFEMVSSCGHNAAKAEESHSTWFQICGGSRFCLRASFVPQELLDIAVD